jgi:hypothetical protein
MITEMTFTLMPFLFNLSYALLLTALTRSLKHNRGFFFVASFIIATLYTSQIYYYYFFSTFYIAYSLLHAGMVADSYFHEITLLVINHLEVAFAFYSPIILIALFRKHLKATPWAIKQGAIAFLAFLLLFSGTVLQISLSNRDDVVYDAFVYHPDIKDAMKNLGVITSLNVDITRLLREQLGINNAVRIPDVIDDEPDNPNGLFLSNQLDIPFETLIENETNPTIKAMHEYFYKRNPSKQNTKTGIYKDYNVIVITAETFSRWAVRQDITPTLYKLVNEGYVFTNFYTPLFTVSTSDGEYMGFTGLLPKSGVWSLEESSKNDMGFVLGHQLKDIGYTTFAFHNNDYQYYRRDLSHPNLGYTYMGVGNGLTNTGEWPQSDLDMMKETIPMFINEDKFHIYYMTVSGHSNYYWDANAMSAKNRALVKNLP